MATFVLIHGSWHGAWCWYKVAPRLIAAGHRVIVPDLPAHGRAWRTVRGFVTLNQMVRAVTRLIDPEPEPVIIVAHSRGGIVASRVAELRPERVAKVVYLAAFMLLDGERVAEYFLADRASLLQGHVAIDRVRATDMIDLEICDEALYADCSADDRALARTLLTPEPSLPALTRLRLTDRYRRVPRCYIELTEDRAVSIAAQRGFLARQPCPTLSLRASHSAYFSVPDELVAKLEQIRSTDM
jgi:pimeloyl-ACP methyl ester carboxylesterase